MTERVIEEIERELGPAAVERAWAEAPLEDLVAHILTAYHRPLWEELPRLETMARKVLEVHRDKEPELLAELLAVYLALESELSMHMQKEERILFPTYIVPAAGPLPAGATRLAIDAGEGVRLEGVHIPASAPRPGAPLALVFAGNASNAQGIAEEMHTFFPERDIVAFEVDLQPLDEPARVIEAVGQRAQVLEERRAIDAEPARDALDRMVTIVGELGDQGEDAPELGCGGHQRPA